MEQDHLSLYLGIKLLNVFVLNKINISAILCVIKFQSLCQRTISLTGKRTPGVMAPGRPFTMHMKYSSISVCRVPEILKHARTMFFDSAQCKLQRECIAQFTSNIFLSVQPR